MRIATLLLFGTLFGGVGTAFADNAYSFATIDNIPGFPGYTNVYGINDSGQFVGSYVNDPAGPALGFLYTAGTFTTIAVSGARVTLPYGINDSGQIVGAYSDPTAGGHGFLYTAGSFTTIDAIDPCPSCFTHARGINDNGLIVGDYDSTGGCHGFIYTARTFTTVDVPGSTCTQFLGSNDSGQIVGQYIDSTTTNFIGFLYTGGIFTTIEFQGANRGTVVTGINDSGQIVGAYGDNTGEHGFLYTAGTFTTIDAPAHAHQSVTPSSPGSTIAVRSWGPTSTAPRNISTWLRRFLSLAAYRS
jgi:probable HAF family extracellular repeat protein